MPTNFTNQEVVLSELIFLLVECNDKVLKLFGRRVGLCVEWSDVNGVQVCCK